MRNTSSTTRIRHGGFTLTELLIVISLIVFLIGITFPVISALKSGSRLEAGLNTISMSVDVARQWVKPSSWDPDATDAVQYEEYSGCAAIYTPDGEVRIVTNIRNGRARGSNRYLEDWVNQPSPIVPNAYADRSGVDYINIPSGVGVAGIVLDRGNVYFVAPPFAIAFDKHGHLNHGYINPTLHKDTVGRIYYDGHAPKGGQNDSRFALRNVRAGNYDPSEWSGGPGSDNETVMSDIRPVRALPFEAIECVPGVVIFDADDFAGAGFDFSNGGKVGLNSNEGKWLQENGQTVFFSPHTGIALRDEQE